VPDPTFAPASPLAPFFLEPPIREQLISGGPRLVLVTGPTGQGKTTRCRALAAQAQAAGLTVDGILSVAEFEGDTKSRIQLVHLGTGERRLLATRDEQADSALVYGPWAFDPEVVRWANDLLSRSPTADCLILDELGPLEFNLGAGLQAGLALIDQRKASWTIVTLRPSLLAAARRRWPWAEVEALSPAPGTEEGGARP
jgi:nucleoside-triphosphatase THEP1